MKVAIYSQHCVMSGYLVSDKKIQEFGEDSDDFEKIASKQPAGKDIYFIRIAKSLRKAVS